MNKQRFFFSLFLLAFVGGALYFSPFLQTPFIHLSHSIKIGYLDQIQGIQASIEKHISQEKTILQLQQRTKHYEQELLTLHQVANEYHNLMQLEKSAMKTLPSVKLVRTISYVRMGDPHKLWLEMEHFDPSHVYGLVYRGYVAGIVVAKNNAPMALLNGDMKSSYAVSIGSSQAPGIVRGNNERRLIVEFIPTWIPINVGDEIVTSGLDQIFFSGLKVGKIISLSVASGYQRAVVEPYFYAKNPAYFHVITKIK